jgi:serine/threonine protein kinase
MKEEIHSLRSLDHPSIVKIHEYAEDAKSCQLIIILEYVPGGSCRSLLRNGCDKPLSEASVSRFVCHALQAMAHSHRRGVVHRDLKPDNMMLTSAAGDGTQDCKIIDFGLARDCGNAMSSRRCNALTERVGTPAYMAPEVVDKDVSYTSKADIWSIGVAALELLIAKNPFLGESRSSTYRIIKGFADFDVFFASEWPEIFSLSPLARDFVRFLLTADPEDRPSAEQALQHPWLRDRLGLRLPDSPKSARAPRRRKVVVDERSTLASTARAARKSDFFICSKAEDRGDKGATIPLPSCFTTRTNRFRYGSESPPAKEECVMKLRLCTLGSQALANLGG